MPVLLATSKDIDRLIDAIKKYYLDAEDGWKADSGLPLENQVQGTKSVHLESFKMGEIALGSVYGCLQILNCAEHTNSAVILHYYAMFMYLYKFAVAYR